MGYELWLHENKLADAMPHFERAIRLQPKHFWAHYFLAVGHLRSAHPADARASLTVCASLLPEFPWTYLQRGFIFTQLGQFAQAEADFHEVDRLKLDPTARYVLLVYRGSLLPALYGKYIFGDITTGRILYADFAEMQAADDGNRTTVAAIHELQIVFNDVKRRMFDVIFASRPGFRYGAHPTI